MIIQRKLAFKLSLYILTGLFSIFFLIMIYNYNISKRIIFNEVRLSASIMSESTLYQVEKMLLPPEKIPLNISVLLNHKDSPMDSVEGLLKLLVETNKEIFGSCVAFEPYAYQPGMKYYAPYCYRSGDSVILTNLGKENYNYLEQDWYRLAKQKGPGWGEPYFDTGGGNILMITYSVPFYYNSPARTFRGVVTVDLSLKELSNLISRLQIYETGYAFMLSSTGMFISLPDSTQELHDNIFNFAERHNLPKLADIGREMVNGKEGYQKYFATRLNTECYVFYTPFKSSGWSLALVIPEKVIMADTIRLHQRIITLGLGGLLIILIIIVYISRNITTPLEKLASATRLIGTGNFQAELPEIKSRDEIGQLAESFIQMRGQLSDYIRNLEEVTAARQKIESELKIAYDIQQTIIPKTFPPFPERKDIDIYASLVPALQVGGDLYDYFFVEDDILAICIGDVSGKGIPASLMMAITRTLFRSRTHKKMNAREIVQDMNSDLTPDNSKAMFVTLFLGLLYLKTGEFEYCNAGHNYPYVLNNDGTLTCLDETHGLPIGILSNKPYDHNKLKMKAGDKLILFTDGVTEAMDRHANIYGEERLEKILSGSGKDLPVKNYATNILDDIAEFTKGAEQSDDITLLILAYRPDARKALPDQAHLLDFSMKNNIDELSRLNNFLESAGKTWGIGQEVLFELNMAVEEVVSNIIHYGFKEKPLTSEVKIQLAHAGDTIQICITDQGIAFNPLQVPPPEDLDKPARERKVGGLGIYLIRNMMDQVEYRRENENNILLLTKKLNTANGAENIQNIH